MNDQGSKPEVNIVGEKGLPGATPTTLPEEAGSAPQEASELPGAAFPVDEGDKTRGKGAATQAPSVPEKPPVSPKKLAANRANAQHSTGPTTEKGKAKSAQNSYKHGLCAQHLFRPGEQRAADVQAYKLLAARICEFYQPVGIMEGFFTEKIIVEMVRLSRLLGHEQEQLGEECIFLNGFIDRILRYQASINKQLTQAIHELERLQEKRKAAETHSVEDHPAEECNESESTGEAAAPETDHWACLGAVLSYRQGKKESSTESKSTPKPGAPATTPEASKESWLDAITRTFNLPPMEAPKSEFYETNPPTPAPSQPKDGAGAAATPSSGTASGEAGAAPTGPQ